MKKSRKGTWYVEVGDTLKTLVEFADMIGVPAYRLRRFANGNRDDIRYNDLMPYKDLIIQLKKK